MEIKYAVNKPLNMNYTKPIFCDTETIGYYGEIRLLPLYQAHWPEAVVIDFHKPGAPKPDELIDQLTKAHVVFHNISYDWATMIDNVGYIEFKEFDDTFILARQAFHTSDKFTYDAICEIVYGEDIYAQIGDKKALQKSNWAGPLTDQQYKYAAADVYTMPAVYEAVKGERDKFAVQLDYAVIPYIMRWQQNGMPVLQDRLEEQIKFATRQVEFSKSILPPNFNPRSYIQVRRLFNSEESNGKFLQSVASGDYDDELKDYAKAIINYRSYAKQLDTFLLKWRQDRIYGHFSPTTISGRLACDELNLLNIPRDLKKLFGFSEDNDKYIVFADFAQLELRTLTADLGDPVLERLFRSGEDLHTYAAQKIWPGEKIDKLKRHIGKTANFGLAYGAGAQRFKDMVLLQSGIVISDAEARKIVRNWKKLYPAIADWHARNARKANRKDMVDTTLSGRKYKAKIYTDLNAVRNQGTGAEVFKLTMHYLNKKGVTSLMDAIHDSFLIEANSFKEAKELAHILADTMVEAWFEVTKQGKIRDLPMPTVANVAKTWDKADSDDVLYTYTNKGELNG